MEFLNMQRQDNLQFLVIDKEGVGKSQLISPLLEKTQRLNKQKLHLKKVEKRTKKIHLRKQK